MSGESRNDRYKDMLDQGIIDQHEYAALIAASTAKSGAADGGGASAPESTASIETQGGLAVLGSVEVGGDFIGGDYIQIVRQAVYRGEDRKEAESVVAHYLAALVKDLTRLKLGEIDMAARDPNREPLKLADVYVPLNTYLRIPQDTDLSQWLSRDLKSPREKESEQAMRPVSALEALAVHPRLTLLGKPGSGKSTFGARVLLASAQVWQGHAEELEALGAYWCHGALFPIRVVLRRFADWIATRDKPCAGDLWNFIGSQLEEDGYGLSANTLRYIQRIVRNHGALILLDGLDECGGAETRRRVHDAVQEMINHSASNCRFLLTARPYAWSTGPAPSAGVYSLSDFDDGQIKEFIGGWYAALEKRKWLEHREAERKSAELLQARKRPDLKPLTENPLLLTLTATLQANRGHLPEDRADLYDESVELLMERWNRRIGADKALLEELDVPTVTLSNLRDVLEELAFEVHEKSLTPGDSVGSLGVLQTADEEKSAADIGEDRLVRAFRPLLGGSRDKAAVVVDFIEKRAGLLLGQGEKEGERKFTFPHKTFQEFLAACHLAKKNEFPSECNRLAGLAPGHWQEVLPLAARMAGTERGASAADELIGSASIADYRGGNETKPGSEKWSCALLAGLQLQEIGAGAVLQKPRTQAIAGRVAGWLAAGLSIPPDKGGLPVSRRAQAGDVLALLGDPRFDPQRLYLPAGDQLGFVHVDADLEFRIGTGRAHKERFRQALGLEPYEDEINDAVTPSPEFYIACFPVTVAQFGAFVDAARYTIDDTRALDDPPNRPVRWVSWREALDYCDWLNERLATASMFNGNSCARLVREGSWQVALQSELEWEKAARGGVRDKIFPWGDQPDPEWANYNDASLGTTSAVGCFPANGYDLYDMSGNVWEWTRSLWGNDFSEPEFAYSYDPHDGREDPAARDEVLRVVRGGSWLYPGFFARCAFRYRLLPDDRSVGLGFRVVLRSAPVRSGR